jgi:hypothetical protein
MGSFIAFAVAILIWPVHARQDLQAKLANILDGSGALYRAVTGAAINGLDQHQEIQQRERELHDLRRGITQQMDEAASELAFSRFDQGSYQKFVDLTDQVRRRLTAMAEDSNLYLHAQVQPELVPSLSALAEKTYRNFTALAESLRAPAQTLDVNGLDAAVRDLDNDLARLREQRATVPFALDRMLPFWSFVFNLREVAQDLRELAANVAELA